jgi:class 3 adenylate cyclase/uncharacterized membrane protein
LTPYGRRYFACILSSAVVIALLGAAVSWHVGQWAQLPDLLGRVLVFMVLACLGGGLLLFRPVERYLASSSSGAAPPVARLRRLPLVSALWIFALAAMTLGGHLGAAHGSWRIAADAGPAMFGAMLLHVAAFAGYIGLCVYFLLKEYLVWLRLEIWRTRGARIAPGRGHLATRIVLGFAAVAAAPLLLVVSGEAALTAPMRAGFDVPHGLLRQALDLDLLAAGLFTIVLVVLVARGVSRPAQILLGAMRRVDQGDLATKAPVVSDDELGKLTARFNDMLDALAERESMRETFGRFVPAEVLSAVLAERGVIEPQEREATVLFTDIERFTQIASALEPRRVLEMLNDYFEEIAAVIQKQGGVITQFQGDAVLAVFNLPAPAADHARRAVDAAIEIGARVDARALEGGLRLRTRIGVSTGKVVGGTIGGGHRLGYTVHGDTVNLAARLEELNKELGTRALLDGRTAELLEGRVALRDHGEVGVRGLTRPVHIYEPLSVETASAAA